MVAAEDVDRQREIGEQNGDDRKRRSRDAVVFGRRRRRWAAAPPKPIAPAGESMLSVSQETCELCADGAAGMAAATVAVELKTSAAATATEANLFPFKRIRLTPCLGQATPGQCTEPLDSGGELARLTVYTLLITSALKQKKPGTNIFVGRDKSAREASDQRGTPNKSCSSESSTRTDTISPATNPPASRK